MRAPGLSDYGRRLITEAKPVTAEDLGGRYFASRCCAIPASDVRDFMAGLLDAAAISAEHAVDADRLLDHFVAHARSAGRSVRIK